MKRFYTLVSTQETPAGFRILLDGRAVKTASKQDLLIGTQSLADGVMAEWSAQEIHITPNLMPLTQILNTKIDRISKERAAITAYVMKYLDTDLLCYRACDPPALVACQDQLWQPWLEWFEACFGVALCTTTQLSALPRNQAAYDAVLKQIQAMDDDRFTVLQLVASLSGSLVLALAFLAGKADVEDVMRAAFLEEHFKDQVYNAEKYGQDPLQEKQQNAALKDLTACKFLLQNI